MPNDLLEAILQFAQALDAAAVRPGGSADTANLLEIKAALTPKLAALKRQTEALTDAEKSALFARVRESAGKPLSVGKIGESALATASFLSRLKGEGSPIAAIIEDLFIDAYALNPGIVASYVAQNLPFSLKNPPRDYWYSRVDTAGSHDFFNGDNYLGNTIPKVTENKYYNAEIYNSAQTLLQPTNVILNGFPVDTLGTSSAFVDTFMNVPFAPTNGVSFSADVKVSNLKGGSRGWGFWNTNVDPLAMQIAWFIQLDGKGSDGIEPFKPNGFYAVVQNGLNSPNGPLYQRLPDLDEEWHTYSIDVNSRGVTFEVKSANGRTHTVHSSGSNTPSAPMAFHNWVDNAVFGIDPATMMIAHLLQTTEAPRSNTMKDLAFRSAVTP